jgi:hypothetical protein
MGIGCREEVRRAVRCPGMSAAPAMTRQNEMKRAPISSGPEPIG